MPTLTYTKSGTKAPTAVSLNKQVFGLKVENQELLKQAYLAYLANGRINSAVTKKRGQIRGGGAKPWRQKGTGRARFGSSRNPIWTGGGVAFGPTGEENYSKKLNLNAKRLAIRQALSLAAREDRVKVIEDFSFTDGKTKQAIKVLDKIDAAGRLLLVTDSKTEPADRATRNLAKVKLVQASYLNVFDILNADQVVVTKKALESIDQWLGGKHA